MPKFEDFRASISIGTFNLALISSFYIINYDDPQNRARFRESIKLITTVFGILGFGFLPIWLSLVISDTNRALLQR